MRAPLRRHLSPSLVISALALFFALGGSAFAVKERSAAFQKRCATGAVKGIAIVTGDPTKSVADLPTDYSSSARLFGARWSCSGGAVQVRRVGNDAIDVRFPGNAAGTGIATPYGGSVATASVQRRPDGAFRVILGERQPAGDLQQRQIAFTLVVL
jgi:hypothetical protein